MAPLLTLDQPRLELECPPGIPAPGRASLDLLKYLFSIRGKTVLHLGCGAGLFAIAAAKLGAAQVWATDASRAAVDLTRENARRNGVEVVAKVGESFEPLDGRTFDLIIALPPRIDVLDVGPSDALGAFPALLRGAPDHLERGGELLTCFPATEETPRFESLLREQFRFRALPETRVEGRPGYALRCYLAMKL
jgi:methylase of polypeptide subunit release factors